jgi:hydroxypyruvate reductase
VEETIKPGDPRIRESVYHVIGNRQTAVTGARRAAEARGYRVLEITPATQGEARGAGSTFVEAGARAAHGSEHPLCVLGSGETTVTVTGDGLGGRNQEFAIGGLPKLAELAGTVVLGSAGTDGIDGPTDAAGAVVDQTTAARARAMGLDAGDALNRNDAYRFFASLGDLILWGPTGTNVGDVHVLLIA